MFITINVTTISTRYLHYVETRQVKEIMQLKVCGGLGVKECGEVLHHLPTLPQHLHIGCDGVAHPALQPLPQPPCQLAQAPPYKSPLFFPQGPWSQGGVTGQ